MGALCNAQFWPLMHHSSQQVTLCLQGPPPGQHPVALPKRPGKAAQVAPTAAPLALVRPSQHVEPFSKEQEPTRASAPKQHTPASRRPAQQDPQGRQSRSGAVPPPAADRQADPGAADALLHRKALQQQALQQPGTSLGGGAAHHRTQPGQQEPRQQETSNSQLQPPHQDPAPAQHVLHLQGPETGASRQQQRAGFAAPSRQPGSQNPVPGAREQPPAAAAASPAPAPHAPPPTPSAEPCSADPSHMEGPSLQQAGRVGKAAAGQPHQEHAADQQQAGRAAARQTGLSGLPRLGAAPAGRGVPEVPGTEGSSQGWPGFATVVQPSDVLGSQLHVAQTATPWALYQVSCQSLRGPDVRARTMLHSQPVLAGARLAWLPLWDGAAAAQDHSTLLPARPDLPAAYLEALPNAGAELPKMSPELLSLSTDYPAGVHLLCRPSMTLWQAWCVSRPGRRRTQLGSPSQVGLCCFKQVAQGCQVLAACCGDLWLLCSGQPCGCWTHRKEPMPVSVCSLLCHLI